MIDLIEKSLLTGLGAFVLTQKKAEELATELKNRLNLSEEKGQELLKLLSDTARSNQHKLEEVAREEVRQVCANLGLASKDDLKNLAKKVHSLEKELKTLRQAAKDDNSSAC